MIYGCIGEKLGHSFSKEIHNLLADYDYELCEVARDELADFATKRDFKAINVTIPYKEEIIPHLYFIDEHAKEIGAVNTVVNRDGRLYGYNTDFYGMSALISHLGLELSGKKVAILGSGGTSKTAYAVARSLGAREILRVSRTAREDAIDYEMLYREHRDTEIVINTTPVGMYPKADGLCLELDKFPRLLGAVDAVYNPLRTRFISKALELGIPAEGGLYMLVAQAVRASEIFLDTSYPEGTLDRVFGEMVSRKENIVLVGMPASGKSTVGKLLSDKLSRPLVDTDELIVKAAGTDIPTIFSLHGETGFRDMESDAVRLASLEFGRVIATGGGAILRAENVRALKQNGRIYFIDRPLSELIPTDDRPLSSTREAIEKRYSERYELYLGAADVRVPVIGTASEVAETILENFRK